MNRIASEEPVDPAILKRFAFGRHHGWHWAGPEPTHYTGLNGVMVLCRCQRAKCGLVVTIHPDCGMHQDKKIANAKIVHKASECTA